MSISTLGIIGLGKWGEVLTTAAKKSSKLRITKGFSRSAATREAFSSRHGIECPSDFQEILNDKNIQGLILTVPNELHLEYALQGLRAGKFVFIEKPITHTLTEALQLKLDAQGLGSRIFVGHCAKLLNGVQRIRQTMDAGLLGDICLIEGRFTNERALELTPKDWRWYSEKAPGGPLSQIAIHQFDVLRYLGGSVRELSAMSAKRSPVGAEVEDQWNIQLAFNSGAMGVVTSSWTSPGSFEVRVTGTKAMMHYQIDQTKWGKAWLLHEGASLRLQKVGQPLADSEIISLSQSDMFQDELERFADLIQGAAQPDFDLHYGIEILSMVEASQRSDRLKSARVTLNDLVLRA